MATARARRGAERLQGNIETRGESLRVRVYAGPRSGGGRPVSLRETVRGTDDEARRTARRTLNRLVAEAAKARWPSSVISLGHVIDEWLRVAGHEDSIRETYVGYIERTIKPALGSMSIAKLHAKLVDRAGRINPLRAARHRPRPAHRDQLHHKRRGAGTAPELFHG